ncbi:MAG TPA: acyl-phosphate glycerol 3-phosphate acyltransferase [Actinobacteria bacterium]|nr:acyl-phosphate glycerol 3-phosphate acyltransferase [Actinomycetota bacterium]
MGIAILFKILIVLIAYLIGSIPTAYVLFRIKKGDDIRKYGSGNVGGTNIIRTIGTSWGVLTILIDAVKGFLLILLSYLIYPSDLVLVAVVSVGAVLGHIFPIYIKFRGGKAIATSIGVIIGICSLPFVLNPVWLRILPIFIILGTWGIVFAISRIISLGSLIAAIATPISFYFTGYPWVIVAITFLLALLTFISHRKNIKRLISGEEKKIKGKGA